MTDEKVTTGDAADKRAEALSKLQRLGQECDAAADMIKALIYARRKLANCAKAHGNDAETIEALCQPIDKALAKAQREQP